MKIKDFEIGTKLKLVGFDSEAGNYRQKLFSMGLIKGAEFEIVRKAPLGDPIELRIKKTFSLSLRTDEAHILNVEEITS